MLAIALSILKFVAIGIGTASGLVGTLARTRDLATRKLTRWGMGIVVLVIVSGFVAAISQTIELYVQSNANTRDRARRLQEFEALYSLMHPLGQLRVQVNATYPLGSDSWIERVCGASDNDIIINDPEGDMRPQPEDGNVFPLLVEPEVDVSLSRHPTQVGARDGYIRDHDDDLLFSTIFPRTLIDVHCDSHHVDVQITADTDRKIDNGAIESWRDLYGSELIIGLPRGSPSGTVVTRCQLSFVRNGASFAAHPIEIPMSSLALKPHGEAYVYTLGNVDLGTRPELIQ